MNFDLTKILQSKRVFRQRLAERPMVEKLALLDALRERALTVHPTPRLLDPDALREEPPPYRIKADKVE